MPEIPTKHQHTPDPQAATTENQPNPTENQPDFPDTQPSFSEAYTRQMIEYIHKRGLLFFRAGTAIWREKNGEIEFLLVRETRIRNGTKWKDGDAGWGLPGGCVSIDDDEIFAASLEDTAKRETLEETNQIVELGPVCHIGFRRDLENPYIMVIFMANIVKPGNFKTTKEVKETGWFNRYQIENLKRAEKLRNAEMLIAAVDTVLGNKCRDGLMPVTYTPKVTPPQDEPR